MRNICIIAHVDHGKTTLVDHMLRQCGTFQEHVEADERVMDSLDLERERGITIQAKNASITRGDVKINIVDTPGHADFGGEVERIMSMVDGAILLVDAAEGPLPQTRFVLEKALATGLKIVLMINKIDRTEVTRDYITDVENKAFDLFVELGASEEQADFPILYAVARNGWCTDDLDLAMEHLEKGTGEDLSPLFDAIEKLPSPRIEDGPTRMLVANLMYSDYVGQLALGRILSGSLKRQQMLCRHGVNDKDEPKTENFQATRLYSYSGMQQIEVDSLEAGDIAIIAGTENFAIGDTIAESADVPPMTRINVEKPTLGMLFCVNNSPLSGQEGEAIQSRKLKDILIKETRTNIALRCEETEVPDQVRVLGRGELQFAVLIENFRRRGFEFMVGRPQVLFVKDDDGNLLEPIERTVMDIPETASGDITEMMQRRKGILAGYEALGDGTTGRVRLTFEIPTRGMLGLQSRFLTTTRGEGLMSSEFLRHEPHKGDIPHRSNGALIADRSGETVEYALFNLEDRGWLFVPPGQKIYEGMILGEHNRPNDLNVNACREKKLTNVRSVSSDGIIQLQGLRQMPLERCLEWIDDDEWIEVTPENIRVRKKVLAKNMRSVKREDRVN